MNSKDELRNELIIGYDLCNDYSQISYFNFTQQEPKTISTIAGEEKFLIPTALLKKQGADKWYFGEEAFKKAENEEVLIRNILEKCSNDEKVEVEGKEYEASYLLETFIKKSFGLLIYEGITSKIPDYIVFTVAQVNMNIVKALKQCAINMGIPQHNIYIQDHEESFVEYTIHQKSELWNYQVVLLEYDKNYLRAFNLNIDTKTTPITATINREDFEHIRNVDTMFPGEGNKDKNEKLDQLVKENLKNYFGTNLISCVFLCGEGFCGNWLKETLRVLCSGRRVFQGENLYTKGACYMAAKKLHTNEIEDLLFLGENKLKYNFGIDVFSKGKSQYLSLLTAGENWYDADKHCELIIDDESCLELKLTPIVHKDIRNVIINLHDLPARPNRTIRISLQVKFESALKGIVLIKDLGFGEIYQSSGRTWRHEIVL